MSERVPEKLGSEAVPVQNRQAAQKLLERRTDAGPGFERGRGRGRGFRRGGGRYDADDQDERVMTLDEWEARKSTPSSSRAVSDQELAMRLQEQFNMEDSHVRLSLFMFTAVGISVHHHTLLGRRVLINKLCDGVYCILWRDGIVL